MEGFSIRIGTQLPSFQNYHNFSSKPLPYIFQGVCNTTSQGKLQSGYYYKSFLKSLQLLKWYLYKYMGDYYADQHRTLINIACKQYTFNSDKYCSGHFKRLTSWVLQYNHLTKTAFLKFIAMNQLYVLAITGWEYCNKHSFCLIWPSTPLVSQT